MKPTGGSSMTENIDKVLAKLDWMREQHIWPNGMRYLWTDAFGVVLLVSLYHRLKVLGIPRPSTRVATMNAGEGGLSVVCMENSAPFATT